MKLVLKVDGQEGQSVLSDKSIGLRAATPSLRGTAGRSQSENCWLVPYSKVAGGEASLQAEVQRSGHVIIAVHAVFIKSDSESSLLLFHQ